MKRTLALLRRNKFYAALVVLRLLVALTSTSTIHPDEHFQNPEVAARATFSYDNRGAAPLVTWEWETASPCRSIVPVWVTTGWAFELARRCAAPGVPSGHALFVVQRLVMFVASLAIDLLLYTISRSQMSLLLFASSPVTFTFLLRPFSNSIETLVFAAALLALRGTTTKVTPARMATLGVLIAFGAFTRVTFLAFATPVVLTAALFAARQTREPSALLPWTLTVAIRGLPAVLSLVATTLALAAFDSIHFAGGRSLILTPLNSLLFNLSTSNLAAHGIHPRWMHFVVNWPMLFGVGVVGVVSVGWRQVASTGAKKDEKEVLGVLMERVYLACLVIPTALLSILPHQEPRFLIPLLIPLVLLLPSIPIFKRASRASRSRRQQFWSLWIVHSIVFTAVFGYFHQGGLVPTLLKLNAHLSTTPPSLPLAEPTPASVSFVFWKVFMPPRHLLIPSGSALSSPPLIHITDLSGASPATLFATIRGAQPPVILVAPSYAFDTLGLERSCASEVLSSTAVHVDMDRLDELWTGGWGRSGVGVWEWDAGAGCVGDSLE